MNKEVSVLHSTPIFTSPYIKEIFNLSEDHSDIEKLLSEFGFTESLSMARMRIVFFNDYHLSVIQGYMSFGNDQGLYEIAVFNPFSELADDSFFDECDRGGDVIGYCDVEKVRYYINKIGSIPIKTDQIEFKNAIR